MERKPEEKLSQLVLKLHFTYFISTSSVSIFSKINIFCFFYHHWAPKYNFIPYIINIYDYKKLLKLLLHVIKV